MMIVQKVNSQGFSLIAIISFVAVFALIGFVGYRVVDTSPRHNPATINTINKDKDAVSSESQKTNGQSSQVAGSAASINKSTATPQTINEVQTVFNVNKYGATGNGKTDDLSAFNKTLSDAVKTNVAIIEVPAGKYYLSDGLIIDHPNITLSLAPEAEIFTTKPTKTGGTINLLGYYGKTPNTSSNPKQKSATIKGGTIWNSGNGLADNAIGLARYENVTVENVKITQCGRKGITPQYGFSKVYIKNVTISNCGYSGISIETDVAFTQISNVVISNVGVGIESTALSGLPKVGQVLIGSTSITNTKTRGISLTSYSSAQIESVIIANSSTASSGKEDAIYASNGTEVKIRDTKVRGNTHRYAVAIYNSSLYLRNPNEFNAGTSGVYAPWNSAPKNW